MLRRTILAAAVGLTLVATAATAPAGQLEQSEKCDDLQTRCLHRENGICSVWHDECLIHKPVGHGPKRSKRSLGGHKRRI